MLVVDDSRFVQRRLRQVLEAGGMEVLASCDDGAQAVEANRRLSPDVITLDLQMPRMDGLAALRAIMSSQPTPVVIVSSHSTPGAALTAEALACGAVDVVAKPGGQGVDLDLEAAAEELVRKVGLAARVKVVRTLQAGPDVTPPAPAHATPRSSPPSAGLGGRTSRVIAIGASTGGPAALALLLAALPADLPASVLVALHMPAGFTRELAAYLDQRSPLDVRQAEPGELARPGVAYLAPGDWHLRLTPGGLLDVRQDERVGRHRPSVDALFLSVADACGPRAVGVVLTGMGADGRAGAQRLRDAGARVLAQDEASCAVFGMPQAVANAGLADALADPVGLATLANYAVRRPLPGREGQS